MSVSKPYAHAQYGKLVLVLVLVLQSKGPYYIKHSGGSHLSLRWFSSWSFILVELQFGALVFV